jgi:hypothetical protein
VTGGWYNGYSWKQRDAILRAIHRGEAGPDFLTVRQPCGLCGDPDRPLTEWHSEDYSLPYSFSPPQTYPLCKACHGRLHKRFKQPAAEWELFCRHVDAGGYGREFTKLHTLSQRRAMIAEIEAGKHVEVKPIRKVTTRRPWWRELTLDPEPCKRPGRALALSGPDHLLALTAMHLPKWRRARQSWRSCAFTPARIEER